MAWRVAALIIVAASAFANDLLADDTSTLNDQDRFTLGAAAVDASLSYAGSAPWRQRLDGLASSHGRRLAGNIAWEPRRQAYPSSSELPAPSDATASQPAAPSAGVGGGVDAQPALQPPPPPAAAPPRPVMRSPISRVPLQRGYRCEEPYQAQVHFHILIAAQSRQDYVHLRHLGMIGLTNADVFAYIRQDPNDTVAAQIDLPCGMRFHERLLLPDLGDEGAVFVTHVAGHFDDLPEAIVLLHGGPLQSWHSLCSVAIRRLKAFYRGLGQGPAATTVMKAFASNPVTLNACMPRGAIVDDCCAPLTCRDQTHTDVQECPWERVGAAPIQYQNTQGQSLCRLRGPQTPDTNWTVLSTDTPEFFMRQREILLGYERDPRMPVTHRPLTFSRTLAKLQESLGLGRSGPRTRRLLSLEAPDTGLNYSGPIVNLKDLVFPGQSIKDLKRIVWADHSVYGVERFFHQLLKVHKLYGAYSRPPRNTQKARMSRESLANWCCLQFAVPRRILQRAPKAWWEDLAFVITHLGWQKGHLWPRALGFMLEWNLWPALDQRYITKWALQTYVDIEREMGEDKWLTQCPQQLAVPLTA